MPIVYTKLRLSSHLGDNQGSRGSFISCSLLTDLLVIIRDEPDSTDAEDEAESAFDNVNAIRA
jgi:hypothetical protein